jgi:sugar phosphate isomerase/epimerase
MNVVSFMGANYVAREVGWDGGEDWGRCDAVANAAFAPLETYGERLEEVLRQVREAGFDHVDLWTAHLNWRWASAEHVQVAVSALERHGLRVASMAGSVGSTREELAAACRVAAAVGTDVLGGMGDVLPADRAGTVEVLRAHGMRLGLENHPERTPQEVLAAIGGDADVLGTTLDTGWYATHGYDPVAAVHVLGGRILHVHLKDVERPGEHVTCPWGAGCVDIASCVDALAEIGYTGALSIEHEPFDHDPTTECVAMHAALDAQLASLVGGRRA